MTGKIPQVGILGAYRKILVFLKRPSQSSPKKGKEKKKNKHPISNMERASRARKKNPADFPVDWLLS